jgi:glutamine amidotransferase
LRSVEKAILAVGGTCTVSERVHGDKLIIPGVGAFGAAMERLGPIADEIRAFAHSGNPLLGICLGQQLLFEASEEQGEFAGLGLIPGRVRYLPANVGLKVPHVGWSALRGIRQGALTSEVRHGDQVYFVHSLYTDCAESDDIAATSYYGIEFPAMVRRGNIWGAQFHPEKSGAVGLRILKGFIEC